MIHSFQELYFEIEHGSLPGFLFFFLPANYMLLIVWSMDGLLSILLYFLEHLSMVELEPPLAGSNIVHIYKPQQVQNIVVMLVFQNATYNVFNTVRTVKGESLSLARPEFAMFHPSYLAQFLPCYQSHPCNFV